VGGGAHGNHYERCNHDEGCNHDARSNHHRVAFNGGTDYGVAFHFRALGATTATCRTSADGATSAVRTGSGELHGVEVLC